MRGEPGQPSNPSKGLVWTEIVEHIDDAGYDGVYVTVADLDRTVLTSHPWSLTGGGASELFDLIDSGGVELLRRRLSMDIGFASFPGNDEPFFLGRAWFARHADSTSLGRELIVGEVVRDWDIRADEVALTPYGSDQKPVPLVDAAWSRHLWRFRRTLLATTGFGGETRQDRGEEWWTWYRWVRERYLTPLSITFAFVATHNHFVLDRGGKVFKQSAPVIKLPERANEDQLLELLGVLNSSIACFWLKQVCHNKGSTVDTKGARQTQVPWEDFYEFTGTKLQQFPLPASLPLEQGSILDALAQEHASVSPSSVLADWLTDQSQDLADTFALAEAEYGRSRERMIFEQEELDWQVYWLYKLVDSDLTYSGSAIDGVVLGQRAFEISLARRVEAGAEETAWFERHGSMPITELPDSWPNDYAVLVQRRLDVIDSDRSIRLLEKPEFKRRWAAIPWDTQRREALQAAILDRLEDPNLWQDPQGPAARSAAELSDLLRADPVLKELARVFTGTAEPDLAAVVGGLVADEAVPFLAAYRYKPAGVEKYRAWQQVWALQRREDAGEKVAIPVPPKYGQADFAKSTYWKARGKLDVPKERFIAYPGVAREGDSTPVLGWAGWSHRDQALALAREIPVQQALGAEDAALVPLVAGLVELEPWLVQWYSEIEPQFGASPASVIAGVVDQYLARMEKTRDQVTAWTPPAATRGRRGSR